MTEEEPIVFVVDDDVSVRTSTERLLRSVGFKVQTFGSATEFVGSSRPEGLRASCWTSACRVRAAWISRVS